MLNVDEPSINRAQVFFLSPIRGVQQLQESSTSYHGPLNPITRSIQLFSQPFGSSLHERKANSISFELTPVPKSIRMIFAVPSISLGDKVSSTTFCMVSGKRDDSEARRLRITVQPRHKLENQGVPDIIIWHSNLGKTRSDPSKTLTKRIWSLVDISKDMKSLQSGK